MAETKQQYKPMHPLMRSLQKKNAREMLARSKPAPEVHQEGLDEEMKLQKAKDAINKVIDNPGLTPEQKKAITAGTTRAWYADFPGAPADIAGMGVDYLAEGLKSLLPSGEQAGFNVARSLGLTAVQEGARDPVLGSRHLEELGEKAGYIPPTTGTDLETYARVGAGFVDPVPVPLFAATTAKQITKAEDAAKPIFTSPGGKAAADISKETIPANKVRSQLEGRGVGKDEMEWTGFNEWIKTKKGEVSKAEIEEFFAQNQIEVREVLRSEVTTSVEFEKVALDRTADELELIMSNDQGLYNMRDEINPFIERYRQGDNSEEVREALDEFFMGYAPEEGHYIDTYFHDVISDLRSTDIPGQVKFGDKAWQLPGGENYRELVLMVPPKKVPWTKEDIVGPLAEERGVGWDTDSYWFNTPAGLQKVLKKQNKATDYLGDGFKGQIVFDDPIKVEDFLVNINAAGVSEELDYGRLSSNELVVQFDNLPNEDFNLFKSNADYLGGSLRGLDEATDIKMPPPQAITKEQALQQVLKEQPDPDPRYTGGHFEENDVVAHIRFNERVDPDGNKVLFIEEIQGDWGHKGQDVGFAGPENQAARTRLENIAMRRNQIRNEIQEIKRMGGSPEGLSTAEQRGALIEEDRLLLKDYDEIMEKQTVTGKEVQPGPFVTDTHQWTNLALKRMIRWGSDNGFDSIAWVTGKQSADRYKVSKTVDSIYWNPDSTQLVAIGKGGNDRVIYEKVPEDKLADYIGKEPANRLLESPKNKREIVLQQWRDGLLSDDEMHYMPDSHSLEGLDLDIGGEYHKLIYDQVLTAQAKKIGKKHGAKVEQKAPFEPDMSALEKEWNELSAKRNEHLRFDTEFTPEDERRLEEVVNQMDFTDSDADIIGNVWTMPLTDKLKNAAKDGMPYYVALPPLVMGAAAQRTDAQRQQSKSDAQAILAN